MASFGSMYVTWVLAKFLNQELKLFISFTGACDQLLDIEVPQTSKTSVHCCETRVVYNIPTSDLVPRQSQVYIACGMIGMETQDSTQC